MYCRVDNKIMIFVSTINSGCNWFFLLH